MTEIKELIKPGDYKPGEQSAADARRCEFDIKNEQIFESGMRPDIVFIGDSITHFMEENRLYHNYGYVVNRGIGGDVAEAVAWRFTADVVQLRPRLAIVLCGCNNMWCLDEHIREDGSDYEESEQLRILEELGAAFLKMIDEAKENEIPLFVCGVLPHGAGVPNSKIRNRFIVRANKMLENLCKDEGATYIDTHGAVCCEDGETLSDEPGVNRDGVHPFHKGYELMAEVIKPEIDKLFNK